MHSRINSNDYLNILGDHVHPMVQALFPDGDGIFQDETVPIHTAHVVKNWYEEHESELEHIEWASQFPYLNTERARAGSNRRMAKNSSR